MNDHKLPNLGFSNLYSALKFPSELSHKNISAAIDIKNISILKDFDRILEELPDPSGARLCCHQQLW